MGSCGAQGGRSSAKSTHQTGSLRHWSLQGTQHRVSRLCLNCEIALPLLFREQRKQRAELALSASWAQAVCRGQPLDTDVGLLVCIDFLPETIPLPVLAQEGGFACPILYSPRGFRHKMLCALGQKETSPISPFPSNCVFSLYIEHTERGCDFFFFFPSFLDHSALAELI